MAFPNSIFLLFSRAKMKGFTPWPGMVSSENQRSECLRRVDVASLPPPLLPCCCVCFRLYFSFQRCRRLSRRAAISHALAHSAAALLLLPAAWKSPDFGDPAIGGPRAMVFRSCTASMGGGGGATRRGHGFQAGVAKDIYRDSSFSTTLDNRVHIL